jgi:DNA-directed RNA polymerase beta subunit
MKHLNKTPLKKAFIMVFKMNTPELSAVMDSIDELPTEVQSLYTEKNGKFELTGVKGIKTQADIDRVNAAIVKEREETKRWKEKVNAYGDVTPDKVIELNDKIEELTLLADGKVDEKKIDELVERRIKGKVGPLERENKELKKKNDELTTLVTEASTKEKTRTIKDEVRSAAIKSKVLDTAVDDILMLAERTFELTEDNKVMTKDNIGITPGLDPATWLQEIQEKKLHWWPPSQGGGATGGKGNAFGNNPWTNENWNMTEQGKIVRENKDKAERMAKAAGTSIGGKRPAKK